jgi:hypothetical protein
MLLVTKGGAVDYRELSNREIDGLIAAWLKDEQDTDGRWHSRDLSVWSYEDGGPRLYASDWNLIKPVAAAMRERCGVLHINESADGWGARFSASWETGAIRGGDFSVIAYDADLARAVCLAALQAIDRYRLQP